MPYTELLVNPLQKSENSRCTEVSLRGKTVRTPFFGAKIPRSIDFEAVMQDAKLRANPQGMCFELPSAPRILAGGRAEASQTTLRLERTNPYIDAVLQNALIVIDTKPEAFYFEAPERRGVLSLPSFPSRVRDVLSDINTETHNEGWLQIEKKRLDLTLIDWCVSLQKKLRTDLFVPLVPLLTGSDLREMVRLLWAINMKFRTVTLELTDGYPAFYLPFHYKMLDRDETVETLGNIIEAAAPFQRVFVLKNVWYSGLVRTEQRKRLGMLLDRINRIKVAHRDGFVVLWLDAGPEGFPLLFNSVDGYFEPLGGHVGYVKAARKDSEAEHLGSYLDPRSREMLRWEVLKDVVKENQGYLPCDCPTCETWHGRLAADNLSVVSRKWNLDRRVHHFNVRSGEVDNRLIPAIERNAVREEWIRLIDAGDKNHLDLAPPGFRTYTTSPS